jgi:hypothetical protein
MCVLDLQGLTTEQECKPPPAISTLTVICGTIGGPWSHLSIVCC